jgi:hypothetical protein
MLTAAKPPLYGRLVHARAVQANQRGPARRRLLGLALLLVAVVAVSKAMGTTLTWYSGSIATAAEAAAAAAIAESVRPDPLEAAKPTITQPSVKTRVPPPDQAHLPPIEVLPESEDACAEAAGTPTVALLFLTKGWLHHEELWREWFASAAGFVPAEAGCLKPRAQRAAAAFCAGSAATDTPEDVIAAQHLFSVYVHAPPNVTAAEMGPLFGSRLIKHRVAPAWGGPLLVVAARHLLWQAFRDPSNQRFLLLSESDVPLWHPLVTWRQLTSLDQSLTLARPRPDDSSSRWSGELAIHPGRVLRKHWRKSSQWFALIRNHVEIVLSDEPVYRAFEAHCRAGWAEELQLTLDCYPDEHYVPTLLAMKGVEGETVAGLEGSAYAEWVQGEPHPHEFEVNEVTAEAFRSRIGATEVCRGGDRRGTVAEVAAGFLRVGDLGRVETCPSEAEIKRMPLNATCFITGRKFGVDTAMAMLRDVALVCGKEGVGLIDDDVCAAAAPRKSEVNWWRRRRRR